ncbi:serine/threonine-protein phosphatase 7 long form homolog [Coffea arabica]|uniref:Serine/threonine-protein phosphatase 7 long form homolog n=1 Tax=Coffea arabica TaxID=13443 RepID=A0A6P6W4J6_COFAR|nr:serine/threonine-protein phosphatase 7 long form homolog [Coffea arabica]
MDHWNAVEPPTQGPINSSVLYLQPHHRSAIVFDGESCDLDVRRCDKESFKPFMHIDPRVSDYTDMIGFGGVRRVGYVHVDHGLITALVEYWKQETHIFHLSIMGEATITLQDVDVLWGLHIDGLSVTVNHIRRNPLQHQQMIYDVLSVWLENRHFRDGRLKMSFIKARLWIALEPSTSDVVVRQYARMYILILLGGLLFADTTSNVVSTNWFDYVQDLEAMNEYSWKSVVLAYLYSRMYIASRAETKSTGGPYLLLQFWAWERISLIRPDIHPRYEIGDYPRGGRWADDRLDYEPPGRLAVYY